MTSKPQVTVTISPDGGIEVEAHGTVGKDCEALTRAFEQGLGATTGDRKKPEWNRDAKQPNSQPAGN